MKSVMYQDAKDGEAAQENSAEIREEMLRQPTLSEGQLENEERRIQETLQGLATSKSRRSRPWGLSEAQVR